jgi:hypothetical protein
MKLTHRLHAVLALIAIASMPLLVACSDGRAFDRSAAEPARSLDQPGVLDPLLNSLDGVTYHG